MASGAQHYHKAEELLKESDDLRSDDFHTYADYAAAWHGHVAEANAHATLALAAATALGHLDPIYQAGGEYSDADGDAAGDWARATAKDGARS